MSKGGEAAVRHLEICDFRDMTPYNFQRLRRLWGYPPKNPQNTEIPKSDTARYAHDNHEYTSLRSY